MARSMRCPPAPTSWRSCVATIHGRALPGSGNGSDEGPQRRRTLAPSDPGRDAPVARRVTGRREALMAPESRTVLTACADGVATLTLNRPEVRNALDMAMRRDLEEALTRLDGDASVRVLVVCGAGE